MSRLGWKYQLRGLFKEKEMIVWVVCVDDRPVSVHITEDGAEAFLEVEEKTATGNVTIEHFEVQP
jgi:anti-sigma-K factor RskA